MTAYRVTYTDGTSDTLDVIAIDRIRCERDGVPIGRQLESVHRWAYHALRRGGADTGTFERWAGTVADLVEVAPDVVEVEDPTRAGAGPV